MQFYLCVHKMLLRKHVFIAPLTPSSQLTGIISETNYFLLSFGTVDVLGDVVAWHT